MDTVRVILINLIGVKTRDREAVNINEMEDDVDDVDIQVDKCGFFDEDIVFYLRKGDHQRLFTYFKNFYIHRIQNIGNIKRSNKINRVIEQSY